MYLPFHSPPPYPFLPSQQQNKTALHLPTVLHTCLFPPPPHSSLHNKRTNATTHLPTALPLYILLTLPSACGSCSPHPGNRTLVHLSLPIISAFLSLPTIHHTTLNPDLLSITKQLLGGSTEEEKAQSVKKRSGSPY